MGDIVDLMFLEPRLVDDPGSIRQNLVCPSTMSDGLTPLGVGHDRSRFVLGAEYIGAHTDQKLDLWERQLGLTKL